MSQRAREFITGWIDEYVQTDPFQSADGDDAMAQKLAEACKRKAENLGIASDEIDEEFPDLAAEIASSISLSARAGADHFNADDDK
jgi:hypothetical protein